MDDERKRKQRRPRSEDERLAEAGRLLSARYVATTTPEERSSIASKASRSYWDRLSAEERSAMMSQRARERASRMTPEAKAQKVRELAEGRSRARKRALTSKDREES